MKYKQTLLHDWHTGQHANMAAFGEYHMPLWYPAGARKEHLSVLTAAGLFDTSHMAVLKVTGPDSFELLQHCFSKDLKICIGKAGTPLVTGRCVYGVFLDPSGGVIDDAIVYQIDRDDYMIVVNSGMGPVIADHLRSHAGDGSVMISDLTDRIGKIDIQGPLAAGILKGLLKNPAAVFDRMVYFSFKGYFDQTPSSSGTVNLIDGTPILLSRTGYTGEFGFEIFCGPDHTVHIWQMILEAGSGMGLIPCGLAARDSLRAGAVLPLSHQDIGSWPFVNHPWPFALPWNSDQTAFTKPFIGDDALINPDKPEYTYPFAGYDLRKISPSDTSGVWDADGKKIGRILSCVTDMAIGRYEGRIISCSSPEKPADFSPKGLSCGFVKVNTPLSPGQTVELRDQRRKIKIEIVSDIRPDRTARRPIKDML